MSPKRCIRIRKICLVAGLALLVVVLFLDAFAQEPVETPLCEAISVMATESGVQMILVGSTTTWMRGKAGSSCA